MAKACGKDISEPLGKGPVPELEGQAREGSQDIANGPDSTSSEENAPGRVLYGRHVHHYHLIKPTSQREVPMLPPSETETKSLRR